jgi:hypothetical protein
MSEDIAKDSTSDLEASDEGVELATILSGPEFAKYGRFIFAILGVIPWVGSFIAAGTALHAEEDQGRINFLVQRWLEEHRAKLTELQRKPPTECLTAS